MTVTLNCVTSLHGSFKSDPLQLLLHKRPSLLHSHSGVGPPFKLSSSRHLPWILCHYRFLQVRWRYTTLTLRRFLVICPPCRIEIELEEATPALCVPPPPFNYWPFHECEIGQLVSLIQRKKSEPSQIQSRLVELLRLIDLVVCTQH